MTTSCLPETVASGLADHDTWLSSARAASEKACATASDFVTCETFPWPAAARNPRARLSVDVVLKAMTSVRTPLVFSSCSVTGPALGVMVSLPSLSSTMLRSPVVPSVCTARPTAL